MHIGRMLTLHPHLIRLLQHLKFQVIVPHVQDVLDGGDSVCRAHLNRMLACCRRQSISTYYVIIPQILHSILYITTTFRTHTHIQYTLHGRDSEPMLA